MQSNTNRSMPEKWFSPWVKQNTTEIASDEEIAMLMCFAVTHEEEDFIAHSMFIVVKKGNKAIARSTVVHEHGDKYTDGNTHNMAEYPIDNVTDLCDEVKKEALGMAVRLMQENGPLKIDTSKPLMLMLPPNGTTKKDIATKLQEDTTEEVEVQKQIIIKVLGLLKTSPVIKTVPNPNIVMTMTVDENLAKAAKEQKIKQEEDLIKKFGKKRIEQLAKTINYKGEIINK